MSSIYGSASGANVIYGKNNIGVAFSGAAAPPSYLVDHTDVGSSNAGYGLANGIDCGQSATTSDSEFVGKYFDNVQVYLFDVGGGGSVKVSHANSSSVDQVVYWTIDLSTVTSTTWYGNGLFTGTDQTWVTGDRLRIVCSGISGVIDLVPLIEYANCGISWDGCDSLGFYDGGTQELKDIFFKCALN